MPKYRDLKLKTFLTAIDPLLVEEYFVSRVPPDQRIPYLPTMGMTFKYVKDLMANLQDVQLKGKIGEELRQISDLGKQAMDILVRVAFTYRIPLDEDDTPQQLAMKLFLKHSQAFEHAWTLYCYYKSTTQVYEYRLPCQAMNTETGSIQAFTDQIRDFFVKQAKGNHCVVREFEEPDEIALMIVHGSYIKTVARWIADEVVIDTFRPAHEDVILYDKTRSVLKIKASRKDHRQYYQSFGKCILGIPAPVQNEENEVYTLLPLQEKTLSWNGNERISSVVALELHLKMPGATEPTVIIKSSDVRRTLAEDFDDLDFSSGRVVHVKFRFTIETEGRTETVIFVISPPSVSDLTRMSHQEIISAYLRENGVLRV